MGSEPLPRSCSRNKGAFWPSADPRLPRDPLDFPSHDPERFLWWMGRWQRSVRCCLRAAGLMAEQGWAPLGELFGVGRAGW